MIDARRTLVVLCAVMASSAVTASPELIKAKNCVACHHVERKLLGPAFQAIAIRYADNPAATATLIDRVIKGGGGNWGQMAMPAQANVSPDESEMLVKWILAQKP